MKKTQLFSLVTIVALALCFGSFVSCEKKSKTPSVDQPIAQGSGSNSDQDESLQSETAETESDQSFPEEKPTDDENKDLSVEEGKEEDTPSSSTVPITTNAAAASCKHSDKKVINKKSATCTKAGYTGDTYCKKCNSLLSAGNQMNATGHKNTEIRNQKDATQAEAGYTGDTYCKDCGAKIASGSTIPKLNHNDGKVEYILPDGSSVWLEPNADVTGHFMAQSTTKVNHSHPAVEYEILRLCNIERQKVGAQPLTFFEDAYCFAKIRANEAASYFSHTRPNGKVWDSVYTDAGVVIAGFCGENLFEASGATPEEFPAFAVEKWMESANHRANILKANYTRVSIAIIQNGDTITAVQNFFS